LEYFQTRFSTAYIPQNARDGEEVSLRKPTLLQERKGKKKRRLAPFEMTVGGGIDDKSEGQPKSQVLSLRH